MHTRSHKISVKKGRSQFALNSASGWISQLVVVVVGFIMLPYIISRLGQSGYGIYQLARSAVVFFMFLQLGMGPTLVRYFSRVIARGSPRGIAQISSTAQLLLGGLGLIAAILCVVLIPVFIRFYEIPPESVRSTAFLLTCMAISLFLNMSVIIPKGIVFGTNRYDLANLIDIIWTVLRLVLVVALFELVRPSIAFIGVSYLLSDILRYGAYYGLAFKNIGRAFFFSIRYVKRSTMHSIFGFSMLNLANSVAQTVVFQAPVLIIGKLLGKEMVTAFAPALLISSAMSGFLGQTTRPLVPFASHDRENNKGLSLGRWAVVMGQVAAFVGFGLVLPFAIFGPEIIRIWLGEDLVWIWSVIAVMATGVAISQVQAANYFLALGGGDIKPTVYSQMVMAVAVLFGTYLGILVFGWHLFAVALFIGVCIFLRNTIYLAYAYARQLKYKYVRYLGVVYGVPGSILIICVLIGWALKSALPPLNWIILFLELSAVCACYISMYWFILVPGKDKKRIVTYGLMKLKFIPSGSSL
jgi:O-antigen/teichoic acid export membrane protein